MQRKMFRDVALLAALVATGAALADSRELSGSTEAKGIKSLRLDSHVGAIVVTATTAEQITWKVRLDPDKDRGWFSSRKEAQLAVDGAKVRAVAAGDAWELELELPSGTGHDDVQEHWTVEVPARFALDLTSNVGEVRVEGLAGGIEAELNVGEVRIDVPRGDVRVKLNVGDVNVVSHTKSVGHAELSANVGSADLRIDGKHIESESFFTIGGSVSSSNPGEDDLDARVNVGEVSVRVEP